MLEFGCAYKFALKILNKSIFGYLKLGIKQKIEKK
jgi:hypothetical protein